MKTGLNVQRALFLSNLREELDKASKAVRKDELVVTAQQYLDEGFTHSETTELLMADGFDADMAESCMASVSRSNEVPEQGEPKWGFEIEDSYGRLISSHDMGISLTAASEDEAWEKAEAAIPDGNLESLTRVFRI